ncbi:unnamed protein product [Fraxinus pennsylvanica]|uniref:Uncharacterized protein n=1 Tax=Fraxinus pennsylvanica TaxID=56036 RepID=A0AAD2DM83_9LAMI|nr:unnamed protein product [Fraxinus pennsylvanica]
MGSRKNCCSSINYDYSFKILLIGDSGVGKSSLLLSFISNCQHFPQNLSPTIGVDFKIKLLTTGGKRLKLTIWDTAGQERFGTLMSSYYRGTHGIILVYDVTRRETFTNLLKVWAKELELYSTNPDCVKILVGNKVDRDSERAVTVEEGMALAQKHNCLFLECSARTRENVQQLFKELTMKILDIPSLLEKGSTPVKNQILKQKQRLNSWQDGVSGTNCPIKAGSNWTRVFQSKDQIGNFTYFPSINFHKVSGGYGQIRVNNWNVFLVPFAKLEAEFDLLIGDWFVADCKEIRSLVKDSWGIPDVLLMNGNIYQIRVSNVGSVFSFNFRIQNHKMVLVETEGSYTNQITLDSLDVHVGHSYSVLVTANQDEADYYMVASPKLYDTIITNLKQAAQSDARIERSVREHSALMSILHRRPHSTSILLLGMNRWNLTARAAWPKRQVTFNVLNITLTQTFILHGSKAEINGRLRYVVNNVYYLTPDTALKLADHFRNGLPHILELRKPVRSVNNAATYGTSVVTGVHKGWLEIVFKNDHEVMDCWHLDGFGFYVARFGEGEWSPQSHNTYNLYDPVVCLTIQVYPDRWTAVCAFLDIPVMWNLRSQNLQLWYKGQEL